MVRRLAMNQRYLCAVLLLAALALLSVRAAFVGCLVRDSTAPGAIAQCCQLPGESKAERYRNSLGLAELWNNQCVRPCAPQGPKNNFFASFHEPPAWIADRHGFVRVPAATAPDSQRFLAGPPVTRRLIYHFQRLLI